MTTQTLIELRKLAEAACHPVTKGRWMRLFGERTVYDRTEDGCRGQAIVRADVAYSAQDAKHLDFIAAANPAKVIELLDALEAQAAEIERLTVERDVNKRMRDQHFAELAALKAQPSTVAQEVGGLVEALKEAATSLETIGRLAGKEYYVGDEGERIETYMWHHDQVRGYAQSRASVARAALSALTQQKGER